MTAYYAVAPSILDSLLDVWLGRGIRPTRSTATPSWTWARARAARCCSASLHPFHQVTGIELNPSLAAIARANMKAFAASASPLAPVELIEGDALEAALPDTPTVVVPLPPL